MSDLTRIANALEHLAWPTMTHKECEICKARKKPVKPMPQSVVLDSNRMRRREEELRVKRMLAGPEQPAGDIFRYREIKS